MNTEKFEQALKDETTHLVKFGYFTAQVEIDPNGPDTTVEETYEERLNFKQVCQKMVINGYDEWNQDMEKCIFDDSGELIEDNLLYVNTMNISEFTTEHRELLTSLVNSDYNNFKTRILELTC